MKERTKKKPCIKVCVGDRYGHLEVVKDLGFDNTHHHYYNCLCNRCGEESRELREKLVKGRNNAEMCCSRCSFIKDRTGFERDGYRVVHISKGMTNDRHLLWNCECMICGESRVFSTKQLAGKYTLPKCIHVKKILKSCMDYQMSGKLYKI